MKAWEKVIKERLDYYESDLPDGGLCFHDSVCRASSNKRNPFVWIFAFAIACIAIVLLFHKPLTQSDEIMVTPQSETIVADVTTSNDVCEPTNIKTSLPIKIKKQDAIVNETTQSHNSSKESFESEESVLSKETHLSEIALKPVFHFPKNNKLTIGVNSSLFAGSVAGLGSIGFLLSILIRSASSNTYPDITLLGVDGYGYYPLDIKYNYGHPKQFGVSLKMPINDRLFITTGPKYSFYHSKVERLDLINLTKKDTEWNIHYIGIPVCMNYSFINRKKFGLYFGGGIEPCICVHGRVIYRNQSEVKEYCLDNNYEGLKKDGLGVSLLAIGGIEYFITTRIGLYIEPEFCWQLKTENNILPTYKREHPQMLSVSTGLRINLGN